jgi:16S rRNA (adenine1518-N6/adenine1519-N6)-dimethyltransferase
MWQKLGQHFLVDQDVLQQMQRSLADIKKQYGLKYCLEIGPGEWALTKRLKSVFETQDIRVFEADATLEKKIKKFFPLEQVIWWDVLEQEIQITILSSKSSFWLNSEVQDASTVDSGSSPEWQELQVFINGNETWFIASQTLIAGNLPYYITSPILRKFFEEGVLTTGWFLIQKEVADKIDTHAKKKSFLRWIMNYQYEVQSVIQVPPESFDPPPRVDSSVITVVRKNIQRDFSLNELLYTVDLMSQYSRKTLWKISKILAKRDVTLSIPESLVTLRVEQLGWDQMSEIIVINRE